MIEMLCIAGVFGFGYFFQSLFGFGASFISILVLSLFIPIQTVIGILPVAVVGAGVFMVTRDLSSVKWKEILKIFLVSCPGIILGALVLDYLNSDVLIVIVTVLILIYSIYSLLIKSVRVHDSIIIPLSLFSGFIIGATSIGTTFVPAVAQKIRKPLEFTVSLNFLWLLLGLMRIPFYLLNGVITVNYFLKGLITIPLVLAGVFIGRKFHDRFGTEHYYRVMLIFLGLLTLIRLVIVLVNL